MVLAGIFFFSKNDLEAPTTQTEEMLAGDAGAVDMTNDMADTDNTNANVSVGVSTGAVKEFTITGDNFSFSPSTIKVKKGDKVKITFINSEGFHDFVIDEFGAATKQLRSPASEVLEFTADKAGTFEYYCSVGTHRAMGMKGMLVVES